MSQRMTPGKGGYSSSDGEFSDFAPRRYGGGYEKPGVKGGWGRPGFEGDRPERPAPKRDAKRRRPKEPSWKKRNPPKPNYGNNPKGKWPGKLPLGPFRPPRGFQFSPFGPLDPRDWPGNLLWGPPSLQGPSGYEFPTLPPFDYHWGPYDCGTPDMGNTLKMRTDSGWLSPPETFACASGQPHDSNTPGVPYGVSFTIAGGTKLRRSITIGPWNGAPGPISRMRPIEHWGWNDPLGTPPGPTPADYRPPHVGPTPGLKPPADPDPGNKMRPSPPSPDDPPKPGDPPKKPPYDGGPGKPPHLPPSPPTRSGKRIVFPDSPFGKLYGLLTEIGDGLDCVEKAMYGKVQKMTLQNRIDKVMNDLYYRPNKFLTEDRVRLMIYCMGLTNAQDFAIGKVSGLANEIVKSPYWVSPKGFDFGGWMQRIVTDAGPVKF